MSDRQKKCKSSIGEEQKPREDGEVGYGRPPKEHRFKSGQSGNPKGRPKGSKNEATIFREIVEMEVPMRVSGKTRKVPYVRAMWMKVADEALKGNAKAIALIVSRIRLLDGAEPEVAAVNQDDQQILETWLKEKMGEP